MKTFFTAAAFVTLALGIWSLFFPSSMLSLWGTAPDGIAIYMARRYGVLILGYTVILWHSRGASASAARTAILAGSAIVTVMMAVVSLVGVLSAVIGPSGWIAVVIEALLAAGFLYYFVTAGAAPSAREERTGSAR